MLLKHENNSTVAVEILKSFYVKEKQAYKWKVRWYGISSKYPPRDLKIEQRITILKKDASKWKPYVR